MMIMYPIYCVVMLLIIVSIINVCLVDNAVIFIFIIIMVIVIEDLRVECLLYSPYSLHITIVSYINIGNFIPHILQQSVGLFELIVLCVMFYHETVHISSSHH